MYGRLATIQTEKLMALIGNRTRQIHEREDKFYWIGGKRVANKWMWDMGDGSDGR